LRKITYHLPLAKRGDSSFLKEERANARFVIARV
jgi:hypothetical protein